jgi:hypothetical protein
MEHRHAQVRVVLAVLVLALATATGCGGDRSKDAPRALSEAERDSVIAESELPGAGVVGRALAVSDSADARARRLDELSGQ